jgi:hypothetical protein
LACVAQRRPVAVVGVESAFNAAFSDQVPRAGVAASQQLFYFSVDLTSVHARTECSRAQ